MTPHTKRSILSIATAGMLACLVTSMAAATTSVWYRLPVEGVRPTPRKHHTMVYVPGSNQVILYGGEVADPAHPGTFMPSDELWVLHLSCPPHWEQITTATGALPPPLHGHNAVYDATNQRMLLFGGRLDMNHTEASFPDGLRALTWSNGYQWSTLTVNPGTPPVCQGASTPECSRSYARRTHAAATILGNSLFVQGGQDAPNLFSMNDLWRHTLRTNEPTEPTDWSYVNGSLWGSLKPNCDDCRQFNFPDVRHYHSLITDGHGRLVLFGGIYEETEFSNAYVSVGGGPWSFLGVAPTAPYNFGRKLHVGLFDPVDDRLVVIGGYVGSGENNTVPTSDVTALPLPATLPTYAHPDGANNTWQLLSASGNPGPMAEHAGVYDSANDRFLVFGGVQDMNGTTLRGNDVWVYSPRADLAAAGAVTLSAGLIGRNSSTISWTAPGNDCVWGTPVSYELRRSTAPITAQNFASATLLATSAPSPAGTLECASSCSLTACQTNYYALKTHYDSGGLSALSNSLSIKQKCSGVSYVCDQGSGLAATPGRPEGDLELAIQGHGAGSGPLVFVVGVPEARRGARLELSVLDVAGRRVRLLAERGADAGELEFTWDRRDDRGGTVANGVYFVRLRLGHDTRAQKLVLVRDR